MGTLPQAGLGALLNPPFQLQADPQIQGMIQTAFLLRTPTRIDTLILDASITETHQGEVDVTDHPVEVGFDVTDHARPKPEMVTIEGIVSNTPLSKSQQLRMVQAFGITFLSATDQDFIVGMPGYAEQAYQQLRGIKDNAQLITVTTSLRTYENMLMTSLVVPRSKDVGDSFRFTAQFKQIRIVQNKLAVAQPTKVAPKKVSTGKQTPADATKGQKKSSILYDGTYGGGAAKFLGAFGITLPGGGS